MVHRFYDPARGRFTTPDPKRGSMKLKNPLSFNRYAYANDDPVNNSDRSGLDVLDETGFSFGVGGYAGIGGSRWDSAPSYANGTPAWNSDYGAYAANPGNVSTTTTTLKCDANGCSEVTSTVDFQLPPECISPTAAQQNFAIPLLTAIAQWTGSTVGYGLSGSAGAGYGYGLGTSVSGSVQLVASPNGNAGYAITYAAPGVTYPLLGPSTTGIGALLGIQFSMSTATDIAQLEGLAVDGSAVVADGLGAGVDVSIAPDGTTQGTLSVGVGAGGIGRAGIVSNTVVIPFCDH